MLSILLLSIPALAGEPQVHRNLGYGESKNERQTLDVYAPREGKKHPIVFWIHGGGGESGDKTDVQVKPQAFVDRGFVFVSTNYRLLPNASIKEMAGDVAKAIRWIHDHAQNYGGDPDTFFVMGHSAGAQLAALVCTDDRYLKFEGLSLSIFKGCVPVDGDTYDVPMQIATVEQERKDAYRRKFGDEASQKALSTVTHVARGTRIPPFLILHVAGHPETTAHSQRLAKALLEAGVQARAYSAKGKDHGTINADLGKPDDEPTRELFEFVNGTLRRDRAVAPIALASIEQPQGLRGRIIIKPFDYTGLTLHAGPLKRQVDEVRRFYLAIPDDDLLKGFRRRAGHPAPGRDLGGWYSSETFLVFGQIVSGLARLYAGTGDTACRDKANRLIREWANCIEPDGYFYASRNPNAPHYIYDKLLWGLLDAQAYCGNKAALAHLELITDWAIQNLDRKRRVNDTSPKPSVIYYPMLSRPGVTAIVTYLRSFDAAGGVALVCTGL
jgi:acetyl esterase/lipase